MLTNPVSMGGEQGAGGGVWVIVGEAAAHRAGFIVGFPHIDTGIPPFPPTPKTSTSKGILGIEFRDPLLVSFVLFSYIKDKYV